MARLYLNYSHKPETPWAITETNSDATTIISKKYATDLEVNAQCKTFTGISHYFTCEGTVTWVGTKAIINPIINK